MEKRRLPGSRRWEKERTTPTGERNSRPVFIEEKKGTVSFIPERRKKNQTDLAERVKEIKKPSKKKNRHLLYSTKKILRART